MSINSDEYYLALSRHYGLCKDDLIYPIFITESNQPEKLVSMPGVIKIPYSKIIDSVDNIGEKDIRTLILIGIPKKRNNDGSIAFSPHGIVLKTVRG
jgi:porphobilinogen synthase